MKKEKDENVWRRKIFGKGKYLEKENVWRRKTFGPQRRSRMEKEEIIRKRKIDGYLDGPTNWVDIVQYTFSNIRK